MNDSHSDALVFFDATGDLTYKKIFPALGTLRPADATEVVEAYRYILQLRHKPALLALSRQPLPTLDRSKYAPASGVARGAYVLADAPGCNPEVIFIASGSEVVLAVQAHEKLLAEGIHSRVVSMHVGTSSITRRRSTGTACCLLA
jgi:transketolase